MTVPARVYAPPQKEEQKAKVKYLCCACGFHGRRKLKCGFCGSEDVFDKTLPEWPCRRCPEDLAVFGGVCAECTRELLVGALATALGFADEDDLGPEDGRFYHPKEDYGDASHRVFGGSFLEKNL